MILSRSDWFLSFANCESELVRQSKDSGVQALHIGCLELGSLSEP
jgi:hypothetical protein